MNTLKNLTAERARANESTAAAQAKLSEVEAERARLENEVTQAETAVLAAERRHADCLAAVMLKEGTEADAKAAEKAVAAAHKAAEDLSGHRLKIMTLASVADGLSHRLSESHSRALAIAEQHKATMIAELDSRAAVAMDEARELLASLSASSAKLAGLKGMLAELGHVWQMGSITIHDANLNPAPSAIQLFQQSTRAELSAI